MEIQVWLLSGVLAFLVSVLLLLLKHWLNQQGELLDAIRGLEKAIASQSQQLETLFHERINTKSEIKELDRRVGKLETDQFRCKNYEEL